MNKFFEGMKDAAEDAQVRRAVLAWIRDDVPLAAKFNMQPEHVHKLVQRIAGLKTATVK